MNGSVYFAKDRQQWRVAWLWKGKRYTISRYKGRLMHKTHPNKKKDRGYIDANRLLAQMQGDVENKVFRIEKYVGKTHTDVIPFYKKWLARKEKKKKPGTSKGYRSYLVNWIEPFFADKTIQLHEIQLDTLDDLLEFILDGLKAEAEKKRKKGWKKYQDKDKNAVMVGKTAYNIMSAFKGMMDYAWRSRRISEVPPFPKKDDYGLTDPVIKWLPEARQIAVIEAIPEIHQPIFWFLKYHVRRPAEACALYKEDYNRFDQSFTIRRAISARKIVHSTKTRAVHWIPCHSAMVETIEALLDQNPESPFLFVNPLARKDGQRYTNESLNNIWRAACKATGENIDLYSGLKHSTCSQLINEKGLHLREVQVVTDHQNYKSVERYAKTEMARKRALMETPAPSKNLRIVKKG